MLKKSGKYYADWRDANGRRHRAAFPTEAEALAHQARMRAMEATARMSKPLVSIVMGSDSDLEIMREAAKVLEEFGIAYEMDVASAHRSPDRTADYARKAAGRGVRVIIAGAGGAAHLAGVIAAHTTLPVIGVPIPSTPLQGMDSLLATVQMPAGIPVATVAIGRAGATNAGILAAQIIGVADASIAKKLEAHKEKLARGVEEKSKKLRSTL
jgi:phosphoribosylaminoimidazole carboxylase PurE protein